LLLGVGLSLAGLGGARGRGCAVTHGRRVLVSAFVALVATLVAALVAATFAPLDGAGDDSRSEGSNNEDGELHVN